MKWLLLVAPNKKIAFLIARVNNPFDENVQFNSYGNAIATQENPYSLTLNPSYVYAPNQENIDYIGLRHYLKYA